MNVDKDFLNLYEQIIADHIECEREIHPGVHFGTKRINKTFPIANAKMLERALNVTIVPEIILFDQLICNNDRDCNGGNLLFDQSQMKIVVIDHSHVFEIGALWDAQQLDIRIGADFQPFTQNGYIFRKLVPHVRGYNPFDNIIGKMSGMTDRDLWHIIKTIPEEWLITDADKTALHAYLCDRLHRIKDALPILKPILPQWKGGG
ncbi:HipA family kinase [Paenibacillus zanthoxyli]|uniref:HipA family kinase n=1 Tax=Paenibacillus zanthoxyli TaxID=369399 RepID=UPI002FBEFC93